MAGPNLLNAGHGADGLIEQATGTPTSTPACRGERVKALALYGSLNAEERHKVPQVLRVWLRYRNEKYFGEGRTLPGG